MACPNPVQVKDEAWLRFDLEVVSGKRASDAKGIETGSGGRQASQDRGLCDTKDPGWLVSDDRRTEKTIRKDPFGVATGMAQKVFGLFGK
jgi:hypothetical protein